MVSGVGFGRPPNPFNGTQSVGRRERAHKAIATIRGQAVPDPAADAPVDALIVAVVARHDAQRAAATAIGAGTDVVGEYDIVVDAAGTTSALAHALA